MNARATMVMVALLAHATVSVAETVPAPGPRDTRVRTARYEPGEVYRLAGFVGYHIHLELEPGEQFVGLGAGDGEGLTFSAQGSHVFLKPKAPRVATNLTLLTDRRHYLFEYSAEARRPDPRIDPVVYSLTFDYTPTRAAPVVAEPVAAPRARNNDYRYCGPRSLKPIEVYDDGVQLHVRFPKRADWPAVFVRGDDGAESLVNFTVAADELIVHRVAKHFILRRGASVGCLINRARDREAADALGATP